MLKKNFLNTKQFFPHATIFLLMNALVYFNVEIVHFFLFRLSQYFFFWKKEPDFRANGHKCSRLVVIVGSTWFQKGQRTTIFNRIELESKNFCFLKIIFKNASQYLSFRVFQNTSFDNAPIYTYSIYRKAIFLSFFLLSPEAAKDPPQTCIQMAPKKDKRG